MNLIGFRVFLGLLSIVSIALTSSVRAESIAVANPSFEDPTNPPLIMPGQYTTYPGPGDTIPGWTNDPNSGVQYYITPSNTSSGPYEYLTVANGVDGAFSDSSLISQTLSFTLQPGTYTLTIASGWRGGRNYAGGTFGLYTTNGTDIGSTTFVQPAVQETFLDTSLVVNVLATSPELGQNLVIEMEGSGLNGGTIDFDNARLDFTAVPEPSTYLLFGAGAVALVGVGMSRRRLVRA
jgi:hypothetical protein